MSTAIPENHAELEAHAAAAATGGSVVRANRKHARGIVSDTRAIKGGEAFVALRGDNHDAHAFLAEAASRGATLLVIDGERTLPDGPDVVKVSDTLVAWGDLARAHLRAWRAARDDARTIAITGSAGKTTTKQLCAALLDAVTTKGVWASPGNLNNLVGVPMTLFTLTDAHRAMVIDVGETQVFERHVAQAAHRAIHIHRARAHLLEQLPELLLVHTARITARVTWPPRPSTFRK